MDLCRRWQSRHGWLGMSSILIVLCSSCGHFIVEWYQLLSIICWYQYSIKHTWQKCLRPFIYMYGPVIFLSTSLWSQFKGRCYSYWDIPHIRLINYFFLWNCLDWWDWICSISKKDFADQSSSFSLIEHSTRRDMMNWWETGLYSKRTAFLCIMAQ